jgi:hypothetical protein
MSKSKKSPRFRKARHREDRPNAKWPHSVRLGTNEVSDGKLRKSLARDAIKQAGIDKQNYHISFDTSGYPVISFSSREACFDYNKARMAIKRDEKSASKAAPRVSGKQEKLVNQVVLDIGPTLVKREDIEQFMLSAGKTTSQ